MAPPRSEGALNHEFLKRLLSCTTLPSLPAVAVRVIELTNDPDVSMDALADTIQNDQALAGKVLRTVNSSFYGLRERCASIRKAIVMMGLGPVKSLTLGFSLVSAVESNRSPSFDYVGYWRRGLFAAVGGQLVARRAGVAEPDEVFLAGLLQDIGMVALNSMLGDRYIEVCERTAGEHRRLVSLELQTFEVQHPDVGTALAQHWRLPDSLTLPIKYHERPTAAPRECFQATRCVACGNLAHDALTDEDPLPATRRFYERCHQWFKIGPDTANELLRGIGEATKQMSQLFTLDTGAIGDPDAIVARAEQRMLELAAANPAATFASQGLEAIVQHTSDDDPITGLIGPGTFRRALETAFDEAADEDAPTSVLQIRPLGLRELHETRGAIEADAALIALITLLHQQLAPLGALLARLGENTLAALIPGCERADALAAADALCAAAPNWTRRATDGRATLSLSIGLATCDAHTRDAISSPPLLMKAAAGAVAAAEQSGGGCVRAFVPRRHAA